jgi:hypothetical protein
MISILLEDSKNKLFHIIANLSEERELHIRNNIIVLNNVEFQYTVYFWEVSDTTTNLVNKGYTEDQGLYDRRIIEYNNSTPSSLLTAWIR